MKYLYTSLICFLIALYAAMQIGCATAKPFTRMSECRHRAVECALLYGEKGAKVGIASGPFTPDPKIWHAQAFVTDPVNPLVNRPWKWLVNKGYTGELGEQETFTPERYDTVKTFLSWQFPFVD